ncbi:hypothetical protein FNYG_12351 [Fusarium nygamai]|uniref:Acyl-CoA dehydrogenase n=1 Tax=Gibberella nygamai TaxID=42673 RepID=A0A2K0VWC3_GIBNY|nr:hypothetical protein FNYG_12351 [Fusarium nygamai]
MSSTLTSNIPFADPVWHKDSSHPYFKDSHRKLQRFSREYVDSEITPNAPEWEAQGFVPDQAYVRHAELGFLAAALIDEIARCGFLGVIWGINSGATTGGAPISTYGTKDQKRKYLRPLLTGQQKHCLMVTEPDAGSDVAGLTTEAVKTENGRHYVINGQKKWITQGQKATYALCIARTGSPGHKGLTAFMLDMKTEGVTYKKMENSGVAASGSTFVNLDDVVVPVENILGKEGQGFEIIMSTFTHERLWVGITALRLSRVALEDSYRHALRRETFGKKLFENQAIRLKFSKMVDLIEPVRHLMEDLVRRSVRMPALEFSPWAALLKMQAAHNLETISRESQQIFGGLGYSRGGTGGRVEQISRDVRVLVVSGGSEEILQDMISKQQKKLARL